MWACLSFCVFHFSPSSDTKLWGLLYILAIILIPSDNSRLTIITDDVISQNLTKQTNRENYIVYNSTSWKGIWKDESFGFLSPLFRSVNESFISDIIVEERNSTVVVSVIISLGHLPYMAAEAESHRLWTLEHNGVLYPNENKSFYSVTIFSFLSFSIPRASINLINGDHFDISLHNDLFCRTYRDIPLVLPKKNTKQFWSVFSTINSPITPEEVMFFVSYYKKNGADHISFAFLIYLPDVINSLSSEISQDFVDVHFFFWLDRIKESLPHNRFSFESLQYQAALVRLRSRSSLVTFLNIHDFLTVKDKKYTIVSELATFQEVMRGYKVGSVYLLLYESLTDRSYCSNKFDITEQSDSVA